MSGMVKSVNGTSVAPGNPAANQNTTGYWQTVMQERIAQAMQPRGSVDDAAPASGIDASDDADE